MAAQLAESIGCTYHIAAHRYHSPNGRRRSGTTPGSRRCGTGPRRRGTWAYRHSDLVGRQMRRWSVGGMVAWWRGQARGLLTVQFVGYVALAAVELPVAEPIVRDAVAAHPASKLALVALGRSGWKTDENQAEYTPHVQ